jgi:hypothetical protein
MVSMLSVQLKRGNNPRSLAMVIPFPLLPDGMHREGGAQGRSHLKFDNASSAVRRSRLDCRAEVIDQASESVN